MFFKWCYHRLTHWYWDVRSRHTENPQNDRQRAPGSAEKTDVAVRRLCTRITFSHSLMASVGETKFGYIRLIFCRVWVSLSICCYYNSGCPSHVMVGDFFISSVTFFWCPTRTWSWSNLLPHLYWRHHWYLLRTFTFIPLVRWWYTNLWPLYVYAFAPMRWTCETISLFAQNVMKCWPMCQIISKQTHQWILNNIIVRQNPTVPPYLKCVGPVYGLLCDLSLSTAQHLFQTVASLITTKNFSS